MTLQEIVDAFDLKLLTEEKPFDRFEVSQGYASDLLSCVMAGAGKRSVWVTLQSHSNVVAVAALLELSAVIITEGAMPDDATIERANREGITLFSTEEPTFAVVGRLWEMGLRASRP